MIPGLVIVVLILAAFIFGVPSRVAELPWLSTWDGPAKSAQSAGRISSSVPSERVDNRRSWPTYAESGAPPTGSQPEPLQRAAAADDEGHWVFVKSASDYQARLWTAEKLATALADKLTETELNAAVQGDALQKQLASEQARSSHLDLELVNARAQLAVAQNTPSVARFEDKGEAAKSRVAQQTLAAKLADTERFAAEQAGNFQKRFEDEQARTISLDHDLEGMRTQLAQAIQQKESSQDDVAKLQAARQSDGAAVKSAEERLQAAQMSLAERMAGKEQSVRTQVEVLQKRLEGEQGRAASLDRDLGDLREKLAQAAQQRIASEDAVAKLEAARQSQEAASKEAGERLRTAQQIFADRLTGAERNAAEQTKTLQTRLKAEQARADDLDHDLAGARAHLAQAGLDMTAAATERQRLTAAAKDLQAKAEAAHQAFSDRETKSDHAATARVETLQEQLERSNARSAALDRDLAGIREQVARLERQRIAGQGETAVAQKMQQALTEQLAETKQQSAAQISALQKQLKSEQARVASLDHDLAASRTQLVQAERGKSQQSPPISAQAELPAGVGARVTLRYARDNESARARAVALRELLRAQGIVVADPVGVTSQIMADSVTYFYMEDQGNAKGVANLISTAGPVQSHPAGNQPPPRPGSIEVSVAG